MIDLATETLIPIRELPKHLPRRPNGKKIHVSAAYRWIAKGIHKVKLDSIRIGGTTYVSLESLQRFADALSASPSTPAGPIARLSRTRQAQAKLAAEQVSQRLGIPTSSGSSSSPKVQARNAADHVRTQLGIRTYPAKSSSPNSQALYAPDGANSQQPQPHASQAVDEFVSGKLSAGIQPQSQPQERFTE